MIRAAVLLLAGVGVAAAGGCQGRSRDRDGARVEGSGDEPAAGSGGSAARTGPAGFGSGAAGTGAGAAGSASSGVGSGSGSGSGAGSGDDPDAADPGRQIAELGAIPAWQAVVDRAQLLARRGQKGVVYGRIGPVILVPAPAPDPADGGIPADAGLVPSPYAWLADDTEGNGALGIRIALGKLGGKEGDRIAASGAWELDADRRWYWRAEALQPLAAPPPPSSSTPADPPAAVPSHIPAGGGFPPGVKPIKQAKDGDAVYFQLVGPSPANDGDGWLVATELGDIPVALLVLPGERASYGAQDLRSPDERWQLRRQTTYWVRLGRIRPQGAGKPFLVHARTAPIRVM